MALIAACGDDEGSSSESAKFEISTSGGGKSVTIEAPKSTKGGLVEVSLKNDAKDDQEAQLVRIEGDHTAAEVAKVVGSDGGPIPEWLRAAGGVGQTSAGQTRTATQVLSEGKYYVVDTNVEGKPATAAFTVEGGGDGDLPKTDATVTAKEYSFSASGLKAGDNQIRFANSGKELHHLIAVPVKKGKTIDDVKKAFATEEGPSGPPPFDEEKASSTSVIDSGDSQVTDLKLQKGKYALICFIQDRKGGPPHVVNGMVTEQDVP